MRQYDQSLVQQIAEHLEKNLQAGLLLKRSSSSHEHKHSAAIGRATSKAQYLMAEQHAARLY